MSTALQGFHQTTVYANRAPVAQVLHDLQAIDGVGQVINARHRTRKTWFIGLLIVTILGFFGLFCSIASFGTPTVLVVVAAWVACLAGTIVAGVMMSREAARRYDRRLYELLGHVLRLVNADMPENGVVDVRLDLRPHEHPEKLVRAGQIGPWAVKYYANPWLRLAGRFIDGTSFLLTGTVRWQARKKTYRTARGKTKTKTKNKEQTLLGLSLRFKPHRYRHVAEVRDAPGAVRLPPGAELRGVALTEKSADLAVRIPTWDCRPPGPAGEVGAVASGPHVAAMMFLSLYQVLNVSKAADRAAARGSGGEQ